ncbi:MAG TPA: hypothetical protein VEJ84_20305 [Acidimicrobiales bacterium]|nr:hypothetical protein [Acidimicrobiales bacterium]
MAYEVVAIGPAEGRLWETLAERFGEQSIVSGQGTVTLLLPDQSALVGVVGQLHDQNITIDAVRRIEDL